MAVAGVASDTNVHLAGPAYASWLAQVEPTERVAWVGIAVLVLVAPFEALRPLVQWPGQSVSTVEAVLLAVCGAWAMTTMASRAWPPIPWRDLLPWMAVVAAAAVSVVAAPAFRSNAVHMAARLVLTAVVCALTIIGARRASDRRWLMLTTLVSGVMVGLLVIADFAGVAAVARLLTLFRGGVAVVGAQVRASGPFQYPTIASMYLEVAFALGLGLLAGSAAGLNARLRPLLVVALAVIAEAIILTFTRAGLITMGLSIALVAGVHWRRAGVDVVVVSIAALTLIIAAELVSSRSAEMLLLRLTSEGQGRWFRASIAAPSSVTVDTSAPVRVPVTITNTGRATWDSHGPTPVLLAYHWVAIDSDDVVTWEGERTSFEQPVGPGETVRLDATVASPGRPGRFRLMWDLEQVNRLWFSTEPDAVRVFTDGTVSGQVRAQPTSGGSARIPRAEVRLGRSTLWRAAVQMWRDHPLFGVGADNFRLLYGPYVGVAAADPRVHSNNMYLEVLAGTGVLGVCALGWLAVRTAGAVVVALRGDPAGYGIAAAVLACAVHSLVDSFLSFTGTYVLFAVVLGVAAAHAREWRHAHRV